MADVKISGLPASTTPLAGSETLPVVQGGVTKKVAVSDLTAGRSVSVANVVATGSTVPANGVYLPAANTVGFAANSTLQATLSQNGFATTASFTVGSGGTYAAGSIYSDANWGFLIRAKQASPVQAIYRFADSTDAECFRVDTLKNLSLASGNLVIGTSGKGIDFSATAGTGNSELFDDYEEGTWTPVITYSGGNGDLSYAVQDGSYTKVGNLVNFIVRLQFGETTASGYIESISGLPFTSGTNGGGGMYVDNMTALVGAGVWSIANNATSIFPAFSGTGQVIVIPNTSTGAASNVMIFSGFYQTTA
jgi:hypothetical protein